MISTITIRIFLPIYTEIEKSNLNKALKYFLNRLLGNIDAKVIETKNIDNRFIDVVISGPQKDLATKYLKKILGTQIKIENLKRGEEYIGRVERIIGDKIYVDIGTDQNIMMNARYLIAPLAKVGPKKITESQIDTALRYLGIKRYFPLDIELTNEEKNNLTGRPGRRIIYKMQGWINDRLDRVIIYGLLRSQIDKIIKAENISKKIIKVEKLGFLEHAVICKFGVFADNMAKIFLRNKAESIGIFMPRKFRHVFRA